VRTAVIAPFVLLVSAACPHAQEPPHPVEALDLDSHLEWMDGGAVFQDGRFPKRSLTREEDALDRPAFLDRAIAMAAAEDKLVLWYVPRIVEKSSHGVQMYRAPVLDVYMRQVVFCDEDVASIMRHRFVSVRLTMDEALSKRFDLRPLEFIEPAVVFLNGKGEVVHFVERIRTFDALWFAHLLGRVLIHAGLDEGRPDATAADEIAWGRYHAAWDILRASGDTSLDALLEMAGVLRRLRAPEEAAQILDLADASLARQRSELAASHEGEGRRWRRTDPAYAKLVEYEQRVGLERGRLYTLRGEPLAALESLEAAFREGHAEAGYLLALNKLTLGDEIEATRLFQLVAQRHPETSWGKRALANVRLGPDERPLGAAFAGFEHYGYLHADAYDGLPRRGRGMISRRRRWRRSACGSCSPSRTATADSAARATPTGVRARSRRTRGWRSRRSRVRRCSSIATSSRTCSTPRRSTSPSSAPRRSCSIRST